MKDYNKNLTISEAAEMMGASEQFLRVGLQQNVFPWGYAVKMSKRWTYYINRADFEKVYKNLSDKEGVCL